MSDEQLFSKTMAVTHAVFGFNESLIESQEEYEVASSIREQEQSKFSLRKPEDSGNRLRKR